MSVPGKAPRLGVNIDHVATLRQARGTRYPDVVGAGKICERAGAHGITVHLREDRRHIQDADVYGLKQALSIPLNLEMALHPDIVGIAMDVVPAEVCLVPERREELTTEGGLDVAGHFEALAGAVRLLRGKGIAVSLFVDPEPVQLEAARALEVPFVELHTGAFCNAAGAEAQAELDRLKRGAETAHAFGIGVNAGHGLNLDNLAAVLAVPHLHTLNIGHSIVARAVFVGLARAVEEMLHRCGWE